MGLLGLGTELIRTALERNQFTHTHLDPAMKEYISQNMGIILAPESCELIIGGAGDYYRTERPIAEWFKDDD
jgi:hypothetical protein